MKLLIYSCLISFFLLNTEPSFAQDSLRYSHTFRLPVADNSPGYEKEIFHNANEVHSFIFNVNDSCTIYIVIRSASDSLDIRFERQIIDVASKRDGLFVYSEVGPASIGKKEFVIRAPKDCTYKVWVKGQL